MLKNLKTIVDDQNEEAVLYSWEDDDDKFYAIDIYKPAENLEFDSYDQMVACESAIGWRLREISDPDEIFFIPPTPINSGDIKRVIQNNIKKLRDCKTPLQIGFKYDANPPSEGSNKNLSEILKLCLDQDLHVLISTAYTPSDDQRKLLKSASGKFGMDIRIPGPWGIGNPTISQIEKTCYRLYYSNYGNNCPYYFSFLGLPIIEMGRHSSQNINSFWSNDFSRENYCGQRIIVLDKDILDLNYLNLLRRNFGRKADELYLSSEKIAKQMLISSWDSGKGIEMFNGELQSNNNFSSRMIQAGSYLSRIQSSVSLNRQEAFRGSLIDSNVDSNIDSNVGPIEPSFGGYPQATIEIPPQ